LIDYQNAEQILRKRKKKYPSMLETAKQHGFETLSEFLIDQYFNKFNSARTIAAFFPQLNHFFWVCEFFQKIGLVCRPRGVTAKDITFKEPTNTIDKKLNIRDYEELISYANQNNYNSVAEAVGDLYFVKNITVSEISKRFNRTETWGNRILKQMVGQNLQSYKGHGGKRYVKLTETLKQQILKDFQSCNPTWQELVTYIKDKEITISPKTIQTFLKLQRL